MAITHKEIAEIVGVSRATVDRVLNNRGRVSPEVRRKVLEVAEQHGFEPSHIGRALAMAKNPIKIGVVVHNTKIPFFQQVLAGIEKAKKEISDLGGELLVEEISDIDPEQQIEAVNRLVKQGIKGLAISPAQNAALRNRLAQLRRNTGLPIVTFNTDLEELDRMCFVGLDNMRGGRTAAGLMNQLLGPKGGKVLVVSGYITQPTNYQRVNGFIEEVSSNFSGIEIPGIQMNMDNEETAYQITRSALRQMPDLAGIYMVSSGQAGACRALEESGRADEVKLIVFDILPDTIRYIQNGVIDFIIDQNAFAQGSRPPRILFRHLFKQEQILKEYMYTEINIKTKYNI